MSLPSLRQQFICFGQNPITLNVSISTYNDIIKPIADLISKDITNELSGKMGHSTMGHLGLLIGGSPAGQKSLRISILKKMVKWLKENDTKIPDELADIAKIFCEQIESIIQTGQPSPSASPALKTTYQPSIY